MAKNKRGEAKSPYNKYEKKPYRYSQAYHDWAAARKRGDTSEARRLGERHTTHWLGLSQGKLAA